MSQKYALKCTASPPSTVYIDDPKYKNELTLNFTKIPIAFPSPELEMRMATRASNLDTSSATIYITNNWGKDIASLCTTEQAAQTQWSSNTNPWKMIWSEEYSYYQIKPGTSKLNQEFTVSFHSCNFQTSALEGAATLTVFIMGFPDIDDCVTTIEVQKRYPIKIAFDYSPKPAVLGNKIDLCWSVTGSVKQSINNDIGYVDCDKTMSVSVDRPQTYTLFAENDMGCSQISSVNVLLEKPKITSFDSNLDFFSHKQSITLNWDTSSTSGVSISDAITSTEQKGNVVVTPDCDTTYILNALGYDGERSVSVSQTKTVYKTNWSQGCVLEGEVFIGKPSCDSNRIHQYNNKLYLFSDEHIFSSSDGKTWRKESKISMPSDMTLPSYTTSLYNDSFIILGGKKTDTDTMWQISYDLKSQKWSSSKMLPYYIESGCATVFENRHLYASLLDGCVDIYEYQEGFPEDEPLWGLTYNMDIEFSNADRIDFISWQNTMILAVRDKESGLIHFFSAGSASEDWSDIGSTDVSINEWFRLVIVNRNLYLLHSSGLLEYDSWCSVTKYTPPFDKDVPNWIGILGKSIVTLASSPNINTFTLWQYTT